MKPKTAVRWPSAHVRLRELYEQRAPGGMSQEQFGAEYGLGSQGMVWQYLNGHRPLNFEAAAKFAKGLRCTIADISPEMAEALKREIIPVLGPKAWLRAAAKTAVIALMVIPPLLPTKAEAAFNITFTQYTLHGIRRRLMKLLTALFHSRMQIQTAG